MAVDIQETSYAESISQRNRCIVYAICKHLSLDPKNFLSEITGSCGIGNIVKKILNSSKEDASSSKNQDEVTKWANFASNIFDQTAICHETLEDLNEELAQKSVLLRGLSPSVVDVIVFSALHDFVSQLSNEEAQKYPNVIRWIDYIQSKEDFGGAFDIIVVKKPQFEHFSSVDTLNANQTNKKMVLPLKCAEKSDGNLDVNKGLTEEKTPVTEKASLDSNKFKGVDVKAAIELTKKNAESSEKGTECSVTLLNLQVGRILKAWKHPSADSLLVEMIDLGDGNQRQVVSGLAKYYSPEDLANRLVVLITNVKPGKLRDVMSSGLVLCASNKEQTTVETVTPPEGAKIGERISFSGLEGKPEDVLNPKKKQLDKITPHLYTDEKGVATYKGIPFMTSAGPCTSSIPNANIK